MTVKVHVNRNIIASNRKNGSNNPPITIRRGRKTERAFEVKLLGNAVVVYRPHKPLSCGAKLWIEAEDAEVLK